MASNYRVVRGFGCPDPRSLKIVLAAGGMSKLSDEDRERVKVLEFAIGDEYKGAPKELFSSHIANGLIEKVAAPKPKSKPRRAK